MRVPRAAALLVLCCVIGGGSSAIPDSAAFAEALEDRKAEPVDTSTLRIPRGAECPEDSVLGENGVCRCTAECPPAGCRPGQRPVQVRPADPGTLGSCCPRYNCISPDGSESCPEDSFLTKGGECKCLPCLPPSCQAGQRPVQVRPAIPETPGSCCSLYDCKLSESVSWATPPSDEADMPQYCIHNGVAKKLGERWQESACDTCTCEEDGVSCQAPMCKPCEDHVLPDPGECCPHCPWPSNATLVDPAASPCHGSLDGCELRCDHGYINDENNCPTCKCAPRKKEQAVVDPGGKEGDKACPELSACELTCDLAKDEAGCTICSCQPPRSTDGPTNGTVLFDESGKKICPEVKCDLHCERGLVMDENDCTFCECKPPNTACPPLVGCRKRCAFGYKTNKRGCPICRCRASCTDDVNETHPEGSTWYPNSCSTCTCETGGRISCKETVCSVACSNPLPPEPGTCCPVCPITSPKDSETGHQGGRGWGTVPIMLIVILALLCLLLVVHIVRGRFRGRLSPSEVSYSSYPPQYYKCVPAYDTPVHRSEKIVPL